jgi:uncharacterized protein (TIGR02266 family)
VPFSHSNPRRRENLAPFCPFCSEEIPLEAADCPSCGHSYDADVLTFVRSPFKAYSEERRRQARVSKKLRVAYETPEEFVDSYIFNLSVGGLFIETEEPLNEGELLDVKLYLPDKGEALDVLAEVMWASKKERTTPERSYPPGMGVKFLNLSTGGIKRIIGVLIEA